MRKFFLIALLLIARFGFAQFTTVSGTVTDPNGLPYALGTITPTLVTSDTPKFTATGQLYMPPQQASGLDLTGTFRVTLADNTTLSPGGTTWSFQVCSAGGSVSPDFGKGPKCFTVTGVAISGSAQNIGATLTAAALALTVNFGGGGSVSGSGTANTIPIWSSGTVLGNSPLSYDGVNTLTSTAALNVAPGPNNVAAADFSTTYTAGGCSGDGSAFASAGICNTEFITSFWPANGGGDLAALQVSMNSPTVTITGTPAVAAIQGTNYFTVGGGTAPWIVGTVGVSLLSGAGGTATKFGGVYGLGNLGPATSQTATTAFGVGGQINSTGAAEPFAAALLAFSPTVTGVVSHIYGLYVQDQTAGGGTNNPDPWAIFTAGTAKSQLGGALTVLGTLTTNLTGGPFCVHETSGVLSAAASDCGAGAGTINAAQQFAVPYYSAAGSATTLSGVAAPTANGTYSVVYAVNSGVAVTPTIALPGVPTNPQTGTTYTYLYSDRVSYVSFSNAGAIAAALPQAGTAGFTTNWANVSCDIGAGTVTITPTTSTISFTTGAAYTAAAASMALTTGQCAWIYSDNANYFAIRR